MRGHSLAVQSMCTFWICGWGPGFISCLGTFFLNKKRKKYFFSVVGWRTFMQQRTNNDVTGTHKQTTPPTTQPAPCTDPCTTTHARRGLPVTKMHGLTPPNIATSALHDTAAVWPKMILDFKLCQYTYFHVGTVRQREMKHNILLT